MLFRFCLYGFLKNQRYYEPFLYLAFLQKGLDFFQIGLLIAFREVLINLLEVPSGAAADLWGRRASIAICFTAYAISFTIFGLTTLVPALYVAMFFFSVGEAFRSGSHKSLIFAWLRAKDMEDERTRVYGLTRSWSKVGSALSVVIGATMVYVTGDYRAVFLFAIGPCVLSVINILTYPSHLEGKGEATSLREGFSHLKKAFGEVWQTKPLRKLISESTGFEGGFTVFKDYLQPVLESAAVTLLVTTALDETQKTAVTVGTVYVLLYIASAAASRNAHAFAKISGGEGPAARRIWWIALGLFAVLTAGGWFDLALVMVPAFVVLHILQNFWRPILIGRIDTAGNEDYGATVMSIESQARRTGAMILAPIAGWAVDWAGGKDPAFWPLGVLGMAIAALFLLVGRKET